MHVMNITILRWLKIYVTYTKIELQLHVNSLWIQLPQKWTHFTVSGSAKQAAKRKENSQRNSKALHFSEIDIRRVQYWYWSVSDMPFGIWQIMKSAPCAIGKRTRTRSSSVSSVCLSVTVWLFPIHLRDVQRNINSSKHLREGWMGRAEGGGGSAAKRTLIQFLSFSANCSTA